MSLLDDFAGCESWTNGIDFDFHLIARFGLWNEDYETLDSCDPVTASAGLFDFKLVFFAFLNWLVEGTFEAHAFHLILSRSASSSGENLDVNSDGYGRTFASALTPNLPLSASASLLSVTCWFSFAAMGTRFWKLMDLGADVVPV